MSSLEGLKMYSRIATRVAGFEKQSDSLAAPVVLRRRKKTGQVVLNVTVGLLALLVVKLIVSNSGLQWDVVAHYAFDHSVLNGLLVTLQLTVAVSVLTVLLALPITALRISRNPTLRFIGWLYVYIFRGVPLLVQVVIWFNFALIYKRIGFHIPFTGLGWNISSNQVFTPFVAATIAFGLHYVAYICEVFRAAIDSVPNGQVVAAEALGMSPATTYRRIILPQAIRFAVPPSVSYLIDLVKATSLVAFVGLFDLMFSVQQIYNQNFKVIPLLLVATGWYLVVVSLLSVAQYFIERHLGRSLVNTAGHTSPTNEAEQPAFDGQNT